MNFQESLENAIAVITDRHDSGIDYVDFWLKLRADDHGFEVFSEYPEGKCHKGVSTINSPERIESELMEVYAKCHVTHVGRYRSNMRSLAERLSGFDRDMDYWLATLYDYPYFVPSADRHSIDFRFYGEAAAFGEKVTIGAYWSVDRIELILLKAALKLAYGRAGLSNLATCQLISEIYDLTKRLED
jgi:hypothetical protein